MSKRTSIFLSKSVCFAIEMIRAALRQMPADMKLTELLTQVDITSRFAGDEKKGEILIGLTSLVRTSDPTPFNVSISVTCSVRCCNGEWNSGTVKFRCREYPKSQGRVWNFNCQLTDKGLIAQAA